MSTERRPGRGAMPAGLLGALALIGAVEWGVIAPRDLDLSEVGDLSWRAAAWAAGHEAPGADVLCLGDSQVKHAILPAEVERRAGRRAYNLAIVGGRAPTTYFLLRRALDAGARPSTIVVDYIPMNLDVDPLIERAIWANLLGARDALEFAADAGDPAIVPEVALANAFPSILRRGALRADLIRAFGGGGSGRRGVFVPLWKNWNRNRGALLLAENPHNTLPMRGLKPTDWFAFATGRPHPTNALYIRKTLDLAASKGIAVRWLLPPIDPFAQSWREANGQEASHMETLAGLLARHPNLSVVDARHSGYDRELMWDRFHLNWRGAVALSSGLAPILAEPPGRARWRELPRPGPPAPGPAVDRVDLIALMDRKPRG